MVSLVSLQTNQKAENGSLSLSPPAEGMGESMFPLRPSARPSGVVCVCVCVCACVLAVCYHLISVAVGPVAAKMSTHTPWMPIQNL